MHVFAMRRYAMSFAAVELKKMYTNRRPEDLKKIHVLSSGFKAMLSWHMMHTLQVLSILLHNSCAKMMAKDIIP